LLLLVPVIASLLLAAPAAYHRIAADGDANEAMLNYTVWMMVMAEGLIALGLVGDTFVTILINSGILMLAIDLSFVALAKFFELSNAMPLMAHRRRRKGFAGGAVTSA
jgi:hypothetical protein